MAASVGLDAENAHADGDEATKGSLRELSRGVFGRGRRLSVGPQQRLAPTASPRPHRRAPRRGAAPRCAHLAVGPGPGGAWPTAQRAAAAAERRGARRDGARGQAGGSLRRPRRRGACLRALSLSRQPRRSATRLNKPDRTAPQPSTWPQAPAAGERASAAGAECCWPRPPARADADRRSAAIRGPSNPSRVPPQLPGARRVAARAAQGVCHLARGAII